MCTENIFCTSVFWQFFFFFRRIKNTGSRSYQEVVLRLFQKHAVAKRNIFYFSTIVCLNCMCFITFCLFSFVFIKFFVFSFLLLFVFVKGRLLWIIRCCQVCLIFCLLTSLQIIAHGNYSCTDKNIFCEVNAFWNKSMLKQTSTPFLNITQVWIFHHHAVSLSCCLIVNNVNECSLMMHVGSRFVHNSRQTSVMLVWLGEYNKCACFQFANRVVMFFDSVSQIPTCAVW